MAGRAEPGPQVQVWLRAGSAAPFVQRRELRAGLDGTFSQTWVTDDEQTVYATSGRCTSDVRRVAVRPVVTGPALVRRGSTVTLSVRAGTGAVTVRFRRAGDTAFRGRRSGTARPGQVLRSTYRADVDMRWDVRADRYVRLPDGTSRLESRLSAPGLTRGALTGQAVCSASCSARPTREVAFHEGVRA